MKREAKPERKNTKVRKINHKQIDRIFEAKIEDEYDLNAAVGKLLNGFDLPMDLKDAIKTTIREAFSLGYLTAKEEE